ncbi:MAG: DNA primase [Defluviitaleaceae bacterium]|nr:DNA primase [Defluviitaleaceae bacterium]MCL2275508.1 DNA primase [Defluviitaleaceae bacterium]
MFYSDEVIQEVRAQNDIVDVVGSYVALRMRGGRHWGLCPFHQENTPSFTVNVDTQFFHCFGCGAGGNVITFVMRFEHMDFVDALKLLADRVHFLLPTAGSAQGDGKKQRQRTQAAAYNKLAARFFYDQLRADTPEAKNARDYLEKRGVTPKMQALFGLGLSPDKWDGLLKHLTKGNEASLEDLHTAGLLKKSHKDERRYYDVFRGRLMFPIIDTGKRVVGFGGRIMQEGLEEAKYLNSPETPLFSKSSQLYALNLARKTRAKELIIVEGYMDVLALFQAGITNTVGVLGTALTARHVQLLRRAGCETALLLLDSDEAGTKAAQKSVPILLDGGLRAKVLQVPDAKDPDEFLQKHGVDKLKQLLAGAKGHTAFQIAQVRKQFDMENTEDRVRFTQEAAALLAPLASEIETDAYVQETARDSQIAPVAIYEEIKKLRDKTAKDGGQAPTPMRIRTRRGKDDPGLIEARKALLCMALTYPTTARALVNYMPPEEMGDPTQVQLLSMAYSVAQESIKIAPADIVSRFETTEAQQQAAEIFAKPITYNTSAEMEKSLNEMASLIKRAYIDAQIEHFGAKNDLQTVQTLMLRKKSLHTQYITLTNG